jgi:hypothetical protein
MRVEGSRWFFHALQYETARTRSDRFLRDALISVTSRENPAEFRGSLSSYFSAQDGAFRDTETTCVLHPN